MGEKGCKARKGGKGGNRRRRRRGKRRRRRKGGGGKRREMGGMDGHAHMLPYLLCVQEADDAVDPLLECVEAVVVEGDERSMRNQRRRAPPCTQPPSSSPFSPSPPQQKESEPYQVKEQPQEEDD